MCPYDPTSNVTQRIQAVADALLVLEDVSIRPQNFDLQLISLKLRIGVGYGAETLAVLAARDDEGTYYIGFVSATSVDAAFVAAMRKYKNGDVKWKLDEWRNDSGT